MPINNLYSPIYGKDRKDFQERPHFFAKFTEDFVFFRVLSKQYLKKNGIFFSKNMEKSDWFVQYFIVYPIAILIDHMKKSSFDYLSMSAANELNIDYLTLLEVFPESFLNNSEKVLHYTSLGPRSFTQNLGESFSSSRHNFHLTQIFRSFFLLLYLPEVNFFLLPSLWKQKRLHYIRKVNLFSYQELLFFETLFYGCLISSSENLYNILDIFLSKFLYLLFYGTREEVINCVFQDFLPLISIKDYTAWGKSNLFSLNSCQDVEYFLQKATTPYGPSLADLSELSSKAAEIRLNTQGYVGFDFISPEVRSGTMNDYVFNTDVIDFFNYALVNQSFTPMNKRFFNFDSIL